ncbi:hypothetical protein, conserved [Trypanosoma brucei brucei TREU927]|uniref:Uncharacterized protein n=1 Tax=Trypanosoma brucei brucei (strain 927/4 GUTat10.1) TaxID=185431 RepID=Q57Y84_TRYB2|nr:hypothetical protein, conserved [Trypanosoma brucei brucei TREU927]AAX69404.1 hypothetical protein, conserved [Trypanosoma brucei]AAZ12338.1 hypothetical protein, conserved [Trypanosoma brucei brucei TREU927]
MEYQGSPQQEEGDAALAKRLHEELNRSEASGHQEPSDQTGGRRQVECPMCSSVSVVVGAADGVQQVCERCKATTHGGFASGEDNENYSMQKLLLCNICQSYNRVPKGTFDAILCGACGNQLKAGGSVTENLSPEDTRVRTQEIRVRCPKCSSINTVEANTDALSVRFECGSCRYANEVFF